jgi:hypothetical protein
MKFLLGLHSVVLSAALITPAFAAQPATASGAEALVSFAPSPGAPRSITRGTAFFLVGAPRKNPTPDTGVSRGAIENFLGMPDAKLSFKAWVYWDFNADDIPGCDFYDTLIVEFTHDRVSMVRFTRSEPVRAFIARQQIELLESKSTAK